MSTMASAATAGRRMSRPPDGVPPRSSATRIVATVNHRIGGVPAAERAVKPAMPSIEPTMSQP